ncbi:MAG: SpoIID/LytB domain-containing protein [Acidimicrobiales bacterium]
MRRSLPLALVLALLGPLLQVVEAPTAGAQTAPTFEFVGGGYGHGVGMSQYGAHGMAAVGYDHHQILTHYYQGTSIDTVPQPGDIRVLLGRTSGTTVTPAQNAHGLLAYVNGTHVATFQPNEPVTVWAHGPSSITMQGYPQWPVQGPFTGTLELRYAQGEPASVSLTGRRYRWGALRFLTVGGSLNVLVAGLTMQQYLYGLGEMPSAWETEALKVQAIAGRSYAQEAIQRRRAADPNRFYDLDASVIDQAYVGYEKEVGSVNTRWLSAVDATDSRVARYGGQTIQAFYSSSSGGHTENSEIPFSAALPYARGVPDPHDGGVNGDNSLHQWRRTYSQAEMTNAMAGLGVGTVTNIHIQGTIGVSGRIDDADVRVSGTSGTATIKGSTFRSRVNNQFSTLSREFPSSKIAVDSDPFGNLELVRADPGTVRVIGWAIDPNTDEPIDVHVYIGSTGFARTADFERPDVGGAYGQGSRHGFDLSLPPQGDGPFQVCVYAINVGPGANVLLGCRSITTAVTPFGVVDIVRRQPGGVGMTGWAIDPDTTAPVDVHLYVGSNGTNGAASGHRADIGTAFPAYGPNHGFDRIVPAAAGRQSWCAYVINVGPGATRSLGCGSIDVAVNPFGVVDLIQAVPGGTRVAGWAIDPDTAAPIDVHLYVGSSGTNGAAALARGDIAAAFPGYGPYHGFDRVVPVNPAGKDVCAYAINQAAGTTTLLGCRRM